MTNLKPGDKVRHTNGTEVATVIAIHGDRARVRFKGVLYTFPVTNMIRVRRNFTPDQIDAMYEALVTINHPLIKELDK